MIWVRLLLVCIAAFGGSAPVAAVREPEVVVSGSGPSQAPIAVRASRPERRAVVVCVPAAAREVELRAPGAPVRLFLLHRALLR